MKRLIIVCLLFAFSLGFAQDEIVETLWLTNLEEAQKIAKIENKQVLVYFTGSDWCPPCIALKKDFFNTAAFIKYEDKFVLVEIDRPRRMDIISEKQLEYNKKVIAKYNDKKSFPLIIILDKSGKIKDKISGYSSYNSYKDLSYHIKFLDKA
jgi:thioredoxin-related protein